MAESAMLMTAVGQQLRTSLIKDWFYHYLSYDDLKAALNAPHDTKVSSTNDNDSQRVWSEDDEKAFIAQLEAELEKVFSFQRVKAGEIVRRIKNSEREVIEVVGRIGEPNGQEPSEEEFLLLEEDLSDIIADVHDLAKFNQLNYTGFQKIIKKHDKLTSWHLKPVFATRLRAKPFFQDNYDADIVKLSRLYDLVRTKGNPIKGDSAAGGGQQNFVRQTTKYWVHPDNITELKLIILKHLPVLVFNANKEFEAKDSAISSVYYDNTDTWELYMGRLKKTEGAEAIRLRWYGGMENEMIFMERKTHREDWTGEKSVKARFGIKEKNVNAFLKGDLTVESVFEKMHKEGKKPQGEIDDLEQLAREIQYRVISRKLVPVTRSFYNRTAFQLPGDARVRISLDTELSMIREDNLHGRRRAGDNWRRTDIGIDHPFSQLSPDDIERFPYAVLEVKLQTQAGQGPPGWVRDLVASHLVEAVPKFSKFIHGTATLFPSRIHLQPFWMPQMDVDIRKPAIRSVGIQRPAHSSSYATSDTLDDDSDDISVDEFDEYSDDESQNSTDRLHDTRDTMAATHRHHLAVTEEPNELDIEERIANLPMHHVDDYPIYDSEDEDDADALEEAQRVGGFTYISELSWHYVRKVEGYLLRGLRLIAPGPRSTPMPKTAASISALPPQTEGKRFKAPPGKRIHVPVRVEPKVQFAIERTFLEWLQISILLGGIAGFLLNYGDNVSIGVAFAFTAVAVMFLLYSMGMYLWRVNNIRERRAVRYHDKYGTTAVCLLLVVAVVINFGKVITQDG